MVAGSSLRNRTQGSRFVEWRSKKVAIRNDLNVAAYLKDVLDQLLSGSTDYASFRPHVWKLTHPEAIRAYRVEERRNAADRKRGRRARRRLQRG